MPELDDGWCPACGDNVADEPCSDCGDLYCSLCLDRNNLCPTCSGQAAIDALDENSDPVEE